MSNLTDSAPVPGAGAPDSPSQGLQYPGTASEGAKNTTGATPASSSPQGTQTPQGAGRPGSPSLPRRGVRNKDTGPAQAKNENDLIFSGGYRQRLEELKIQITQLSTRNTESTMRLLRAWLKDAG